MSLLACFARRAALRVALAGSLTGLMPALAAADSYPERPIKLVVPWPAGGTADTRARQIGEVLERALRQSVFVENKPGAGATIGAALVARAKPDGYTLLWGSVNELALRPAAGPLPYDAARDFSPVSLVNANPLLLVAHPSSNIRSVNDLVSAARAKPGQLSYASAGNGTVHHFAGALLERRTGVSLNHVPYKGEAPAVADVLAGHVPLGFCLPAPCRELIRSGKLNALMVTSARRTTSLPDVPSAKDAGVDGLEIVSWAGLLAPAGTAPETVARLRGAIAAAIDGGPLRQTIEASGSEATATTPEEFRRYLDEQDAKWQTILRETGIRLDE